MSIFEPQTEAQEPPPYILDQEPPQYMDTDFNPFDYLGEQPNYDDIPLVSNAPQIKREDVISSLMAGIEDLPSYPVWSKLEQPNDKLMTDAAFGADHGMAHLLEELFDGRVVWDLAQKQWFIWMGDFWALDDGGALKKLVFRLIPKMYINRHFDVLETIKDKKESTKEPSSELIKEIEAMEITAEKFAETSRAFKVLKRHKELMEALKILVSVKGEVWDTRANSVAFRNGVVNMVTGEFSRGVPDDYVRTYTDIEWKGVDTPCPTWDRVTLELCGGDEALRDYLLDLYAYALMGNPIHQILPVLQGSGSNGKSMLIKVMAHVFGDLSSAAGHNLILNMGKPMGDAANPTLARLQGQRMVSVVETGTSQWLDEATLKLVTGSDEITARMLRANPVTFDPTHTVFLVTNVLPHIQNPDDKALMRRIKVIVFPMTFFAVGSKDYIERYDESNPMHGVTELGLEERLINEESEGIAADLIRRSIALHRRGMQLNDPSSVIKQTNAYAKSEDLVLEFLDSHCKVDNSSYEVKTNELYGHFKEFIVSSGYGRPMSQRSLTSNLIKKGYTRREANGQGVTVGIRMKRIEEMAI